MAIEGVIGAGSSLIGWSAEGLALFDRFRLNLIAVSRRGTRLGERPGRQSPTAQPSPKSTRQTDRWCMIPASTLVDRR